MTRIWLRITRHGTFYEILWWCDVTCRLTKNALPIFWKTEAKSWRRRYALIRAFFSINFLQNTNGRLLTFTYPWTISLINVGYVGYVKRYFVEMVIWYAHVFHENNVWLCYTKQVLLFTLFWHYLFYSSFHCILSQNGESSFFTLPLFRFSSFMYFALC